MDDGGLRTDCPRRTHPCTLFDFPTSPVDQSTQLVTEEQRILARICTTPQVARNTQRAVCSIRAMHRNMTANLLEET